MVDAVAGQVKVNKDLNVGSNTFEGVAWAPEPKTGRSITGNTLFAKSGDTNQYVQEVRSNNSSQSKRGSSRVKESSFYGLQEIPSGRGQTNQRLATKSKAQALNVNDVSKSRGSATYKNTSPVANKTTSSSQSTNQTTVANANVQKTDGKLAPSASELAKERSAMLNTVDKLVESALGKGKYTKPTDHRGYTALVSKALKSMKSVAEQTAFKNSIEAAGKPFGLNFGLSNKVNGKQVALNQGTVAKLDANHRAEYSKFAQEFSTTQQKKTVDPVKQHEKTKPTTLPSERYPSSLIA
jgi:hypothetical protein